MPPISDKTNEQVMISELKVFLEAIKTLLNETLLTKYLRVKSIFV